MTLTRQHFQMIADVIRAERTDLPTEDMTDHGLDVLSRAFADKLAATNGQFDRARFLTACGVEA